MLKNFMSNSVRWSWKTFSYLNLTKNVTLDPSGKAQALSQQVAHSLVPSRQLFLLWLWPGNKWIRAILLMAEIPREKTTWDGGKSLINKWDFNYRSLNWWVCRIAEPSTVGLCWFEKRFWTLEGFCRSTSTRTLDLPSITSLKRWGPKRKPECLMGHCHRQVLQLCPRVPGSTFFGRKTLKSSLLWAKVHPSPSLSRFKEKHETPLSYPSHIVLLRNLWGMDDLS